MCLFSREKSVNNTRFLSKLYVIIKTCNLIETFLLFSQQNVLLIETAALIENFMN